MGWQINYHDGDGWKDIKEKEIRKIAKRNAENVDVYLEGVKSYSAKNDKGISLDLSSSIRFCY